MSVLPITACSADIGSGAVYSARRTAAGGIRRQGHAARVSADTLRRYGRDVAEPSAWRSGSKPRVFQSASPCAQSH